MGLDMYLMKVKKNNILESKTMITLASDLYRKNERNAALFEVFENLGLTYKYTRWEHIGEEVSLYKEVAYWRKANAIHKWIYENCALAGQEDSEDIKVEKEHIEKLIECCKLVLEDLKTCPKTSNKLQMGMRNGEPIYEDVGLYDSKVAKELLPTQDGFFFGSTQYAEWYKEDLEYTVEKLTKVLEETDFENEDLWYYASY